MCSKKKKQTDIGGVDVTKRRWDASTSVWTRVANEQRHVCAVLNFKLRLELHNFGALFQAHLDNHVLRARQRERLDADSVCQNTVHADANVGDSNIKDVLRGGLHDIVNKQKNKTDTRQSREKREKVTHLQRIELVVDLQANFAVFRQLNRCLVRCEQKQHCDWENEMRGNSDTQLVVPCVD